VPNSKGIPSLAFIHHFRRLRIPAKRHLKSVSPSVCTHVTNGEWIFA